MPGWAVSGVAALVGIAAGLVLAVPIRDQRARREQAATAAFAALPSYRVLIGAALSLVELLVWRSVRDKSGQSAGDNSGSGDPDELARPVVYAARALAFQPAPVYQPADAVVTAAREVARVVVEIRSTTRPGPGGAVDLRVADRHAAAVAELRDARDRFVTVCRVALGVEQGSRRI
ncbi:hypothetical protein [Actinocrispum wychmicini]|uniref:hypothetical protein n=1 Tax=Actinocrispum wychmicini TaxID=1213861 RepID=UPI00104DB8EB|nr:hypothetical protein [Actinocrispum wychmicini]